MMSYFFPLLDVVATGENINRSRKKAGYSVKELQDIFGFGTPQAIYKWLRGDSMPSLDNLIILASVLNVTVDEILVVEKGGN